MARIVVVGPHPDDQELGMGATIARLADQGHEVLLLDMTNGEPTPHGSVETRTAEAAAAVRALAPPDRPGSVTRLCIDLPNRELAHTLHARHAVAAVYRAHQADIVFLPYPKDAHPDHRATTTIAEDARFDAKLTKLDLADPVDAWTSRTLPIGPPIYPSWCIYYYCTHLRWVADPTFVFDATGYMDRKRAAIEAYETQFVIPRANRRVLDSIAASATYFGSRIGADAGEPFHTIEPVGLTSLDSLASPARREIKS